jgi:hypothetical protein
LVGKSIKVTCRYGLVFIGRFEMTDTITLEPKIAVLIDNNTVYLEDIQEIRILPQDQKIIGGVLSLLGVGVTIGGVSTIIQERKKSEVLYHPLLIARKRS